MRLGYRGEGGVLVREVVPYGAAQQVGIQRGAIVLAINGQRVRSPAHARDLAGRITPGAAVSLMLYDREYGERVINYRTRQ
jgi:serine protease Do